MDGAASKRRAKIISFSPLNYQLFAFNFIPTFSSLFCLSLSCICSSHSHIMCCYVVHKQKSNFHLNFPSIFPNEQTKLQAQQLISERDMRDMLREFHAHSVCLHFFVIYFYVILFNHR